jgi:hypothetical protein
LYWEGKIYDIFILSNDVENERNEKAKFERTMPAIFTQRGSET